MTVNEWTFIFGLTTPLRNKKGSFSSNRSQMYLDVHLTRQLKNKHSKRCAKKMHQQLVTGVLPSNIHLCTLSNIQLDKVIYTYIQYYEY